MKSIKESLDEDLQISTITQTNQRYLERLKSFKVSISMIYRTIFKHGFH